MTAYTVPVTRQVLDTYVVEARNGTDAGMRAAAMIAAEAPPTFSQEISRRVGSAKLHIVEEAQA